MALLINRVFIESLKMQVSTRNMFHSSASAAGRKSLLMHLPNMLHLLGNCCSGKHPSPDHYLVGHCIDGRILYPATGYLVLAWRSLAGSLGMAMEQTAVMFEDVTIHQATILPKKGE